MEARALIPHVPMQSGRGANVLTRLPGTRPSIFDIVKATIVVMLVG